MAYPEYDPNEPSLGQTFADLLRGMSKKQSYQELGQGIRNVAKVTPSVVESLGRGALVQLPALAGDTSQLARQFIPETMQNTFGNRTAPTSEELLAKIPRINPDYQGSQQHEMVGGLISPAMPYLLRAGATATKNMPIGNMIAYHGTPHEIQGAFDLKKVGTGEGAQAYGHGMYFAESPKVAESYAGISPTSGSYPPMRRSINGVEVEVGTPEAHAATLLNANGMTVKKAKDLVNSWINDPSAMSAGENTIAGWKKTLDTLNTINKKSDVKDVGSGNLYKVDIPDAYIPTMMDYDKPLSQQSAIVKKALNQLKKQITPEMKMELGGDLNLLFGKDVTPVQFLNTMEIIHPTGGVGIGEKMLNELGVKGMRYLDATSRGANKGTSNFVIFDPKEVKILEKNNKPVTRKEILEEQIKKIE